MTLKQHSKKAEGLQRIAKKSRSITQRKNKFTTNQRKKNFTQKLKWWLKIEI